MKGIILLLLLPIYSFGQIDVESFSSLLFKASDTAYTSTILKKHNYPAFHVNNRELHSIASPDSLEGIYIVPYMGLGRLYTKAINAFQSWIKQVKAMGFEFVGEEYSQYGYDSVYQKGNLTYQIQKLPDSQGEYYRLCITIN